MCRAGGRRCESHWNEDKRQADLARRRRIYHARKNTSTDDSATAAQPGGEHLSPGVSEEPISVPSSISEAQEAYFANTTTRDADGNLLRVYHGSAVDFDAFDSSLLGRGNDSWGNGFYFTNDKETAESYGGTVKEFHLNVTNPIRVDGVEHMGLSTAYQFSSEDAAAILKAHPLAYIQPTDEDEMNFLGDYAEDFWEKDEHTREEFDAMIDRVARDYFDQAEWANLESVFGRENGSAFLTAVRDTTGHDGVVVEFEESEHHIAWFPNQMKLTSNDNPQDDDKF